VTIPAEDARKECIRIACDGEGQKIMN